MQEKAIPVCCKSSKWARTPVWLNSELHGGQEEKETVISESEVRHHRKSTELWFAYEERRFERPKTQSRDWSLLYLTTGKGFLKYINSKEKSTHWQENTLTLVEGGHLTNTGVERAETVFVSIFNNIDRPWAAQFFDLEDHMSVQSICRQWNCRKPVVSAGCSQVRGAWWDLCQSSEGTIGFNRTSVSVSLCTGRVWEKTR